MKRLQQSRTALGSQALLTVVVTDNENIDELFTELWSAIETFEQRFSRFRPDSELSRFNAEAGTWVKTSPAFHKLLVACRELSNDTSGLFNPFILPGLQQAGYVGSWPSPAVFKTSQDYRKRRVVNIDSLEIRKDTARIPGDSALEFGGIGKGYLLDELSEQLAKADQANYWLSLGGDIICSGHDIDGGPWTIQIQDATKPEKSVGTISNTDGGCLAIATSGITKRKGEKNGSSWHHIIDPRSGLPAETDLLTVTVSGRQAVRADIYAKCLVILGSAHVKQFLADHPLESVHLQAAKPTAKDYTTRKR